MSDEIQSNLANFLNDIGVKDAKTFQGIGDLIGAVADAAGAAGAISLVVGLFTNQGDPLQALLDTIQRDFQQLQADLKAQHIIERRTNQANAIGPAKAVLDTLDSLVSQQPPLTGPERLEQIQPCITAIEELSPDALWETPFNDQIFWTDAGSYMWPILFPPNPRHPELGPTQIPLDRGYGEQAPTADSSAVVFNYFYILAAYVEALFIFLAVAASLFPDFAQRFAEKVLRPVIDLLQTRHDTILSGITRLSPGQWDRQKLLDLLSQVFIQSTAGITPLASLASVQGLVRSLTPLVPLPPAFLGSLGGVNIEYGAVETFSGSSSVADYKITFQEIEAMPESDASAFNKFQIRLEKKAKDVYVAVGLLSVWQLINRLKAMVGDAPLARPNFADWSFRNIISTTQISPRPDGSFHLSDLARFLTNTVPLDTAPSAAFSFRALLI
jgi:hypothetical protein